jgi:hypothetical protein
MLNKTISSNTSERKQVPLRLLPTTIEKLKEVAKAEQHSMNALLEKAILNYLEQ